MLEAFSEPADCLGELAVDRIAGAARRRGMVRLVENQHRTRPEVPEQVAQAADVGLVRHQRVRNEEPRSGRPGVGAIAPLASEDGEIVAVDDREAQAELRFELILPLSHHARWRGDNREVDPPAQQEFAKDQPGLDGLAGADVVGDQQVHARKTERLSEREELIGVLVNARTEWRLKEVPVGCGRGVPPERAKVGGKNARIVGPHLRDVGPSLADKNLGVEFGVPEDRDSFALGVVIDGGEANRVQACNSWPVLDEPTARTNTNEIPRLWRPLHLSHRALPGSGCSRQFESSTGVCVAQRRPTAHVTF